jgi:hypothetical protein
VDIGSGIFGARDKNLELRSEEGMRFRIRRADIDQERRGHFERYGKEVIALALGLGSLSPGSVAVTHALQTVILHQHEASLWLQEKRDEEERDKTRNEIVEWAVLIFVILGVAVESVMLAKGLVN